MKLLLIIILLLSLVSIAESQTRNYPVIANFSGSKFAARYGITPKDFWIEGGRLFLRDGATVKDDPPIQEAADAPNIVARNTAKITIDRTNANEVLLRAIVAVLIDELNTLRALHSLPPRTLSQAVTAVKNKIDSGGAD